MTKASAEDAEEKLAKILDPKFTILYNNKMEAFSSKEVLNESEFS